MIKSRVATDAYRKGFDITFSKVNGSQAQPAACSRGEHEWVLVEGEPWQCKFCPAVEQRKQEHGEAHDYTS